MYVVALIVVVIGLLFLLVGYDRNSIRLGSISVDGKTHSNSRIITPKSWINKRVGLLNHFELQENFGLWITGTSSVHTIGMLTPIDIVFVDKRNTVVEIIRSANPGKKRIAAKSKAQGAIELPCGGVTSLGISVGSVLNLVPVTPSFKGLY